MKELKTYAHLYLGCEVRNYYGNETYDEGVLVGISASEVEPNKTIAIFSNGGTVFQECYIEDAKLILRPLSDMTEEELRELIRYDKLKEQYENPSYERIGFDKLTGIDIHYYIPTEEGSLYNSWTLNFHAMNAHDFAWCLSKGFDLFQLIDAGLAVSKTEGNERSF